MKMLTNKTSSGSEKEIPRKESYQGKEEQRKGAGYVPDELVWMNGGTVGSLCKGKKKRCVGARGIK